jgi:hypothetical protein
LAEISGFEEDFIREVCFSEPLKKKVEEIRDRRLSSHSR